MSGERKSIVINANSLLGGGSSGGGARRNTKRASNGERKLRPSSIVQPSTLKKTLLERIKQHQRTRERAREHVDVPIQESQPVGGSGGSGGGDDTTFSQSMDFLRKLAMKRRQQQQQTQKHRGDGRGLPEAKTPEAKMLNQVAETLHNGEILTNTGLLGLPVVQTLITHNTGPAPPAVMSSPMVSLGPMPMPMPMMSPQMPMMSPMMPMMPQEMPQETPIPKISELAEMYNNTIAGASAAAIDTPPPEATAAPLHIPSKLEDFLPSIFLKDEPPHGCLKNGKKPTFREWATKMLGGSSEPATTTTSSNNEPTGLIGGGGGGGGSGSGSGGEIHPDQVAGMRVKIRKTKKKSYRIGKHDDVVGVLLKNKQTQRHIQNQHLTLKQKTIGEIRKYLYDHQLLKVGSNAPPDVLRRMYEDSIMTGDVKNTNNDVLLHNFMSGGGGE